MTTLAPTGTADPNWWRQAIVYQIYPRSFHDSDGDGLGDIRGITEKLPYLGELGVDAIWLSPFYPSALADGGYDVSDYRAVDPRLGTLEDFDAMTARAHALGIKVMVDIVPNHTSDEHVWFQEALRSPRGSRARERYVFRDGRGDDGELPPSDWKSVFGGPAWHRVPDGQWYLHLFAPEQPDLNWDDAEVREDFLRTLRFWSDRGVDGFRVDVAHGLAKDLAEPLRDLGEVQREALSDAPDDGSHPLWDRNEVHEIFREWRKVLNEYDPPRTAVAEAWVRDSRRVLYADPSGLGQAFNFEFLRCPWSAREFRDVIDASMSTARAAGASATWVLSNHDVVRHASRYALPQDADLDAWLMAGGRSPAPDRELGLRRARAATLLMLALPGSSYVYQGEELGLPEVADLTADALRDPKWERSGHQDKGRDGCRVPLPWAAEGPTFGFGPDGSARVQGESGDPDGGVQGEGGAPDGGGADSGPIRGGSPWLPQPAGFGGYAVDAQSGVADSTLEMYRAALRLRRELLSDEELTWVSSEADADSGVLHFSRSGGWHCVINVSEQPVPVPPGDVLISSAPLADGRLMPATAVWLRVAD